MEFEKFEEITEKGFDLDNKLKNSTSFSELFNAVDAIEELYKESDKLLIESESLKLFKLTNPFLFETALFVLSESKTNTPRIGLPLVESTSVIF